MAEESRESAGDEGETAFRQRPGRALSARPVARASAPATVPSDGSKAISAESAAGLTRRDLLMFVLGTGALAGFLGVMFLPAPPFWLTLGCLILYLSVSGWFIVQSVRRGSIPLGVLGFSSFVMVGGVCLLPRGSMATPEAHAVRCEANLRSIALALRQYDAEYGCLPPACIRDAEGKPMHSWRVLVLPFLDQQDLYEEYDFGEPWNGPHNLQLASRMPPEYLCRFSRADPIAPPITRYLVVAGEGTAWNPAAAVRLKDISDPPDATILVVESSAAPVHWMEPRDLELKAMELAINAGPGPSVSSLHNFGGAHAAMVDGSVVRLPASATGANSLRAMLTICGAEPRAEFASLPPPR